MSDESLLFGVLPSEFAGPEELSEDLKDFEVTVSQIVSAYQSGIVSADACAGALSRMVISDHNGMEWTIGATTLRWYRRIPGGDWRSATPTSSESGDELHTSVQRAKDVARETIAHAQAPSAVTTVSEPEGDVSPVLDSEVKAEQDQNNFF